VAEEALAIALYAALAGRDFENGLRIAVTHSGDSDSTGAIAGNLLGLLYPRQVFEHRWAKEVGGREIIAKLAVDLPMARWWSSEEAERQWATYPGW
jgi:ADP-ribosylglycohydrolase